MIDTHSHLLPGIDDGPRTEEESLRMCRIAEEDGIGVVIATPHSFDGRFSNEPENIRAMVADVNNALSTEGIGLHVLPGMEVRVFADIPEVLEAGRILPLSSGRYILIEFHPSQLPAGFENLAKRLSQRGYGIVLAHPEKNTAIQRNPHYLFKLLQSSEPGDMLIQLSAGSLTGRNGFWASRTAKILLTHQLVHLLATDAHSAERRGPRLADAVAKAAELIGKENAMKLVKDIPHAVLGSGELPELSVPLDPRRWWRIL
jgi:protein-tyrosine phosphatase